MLESLWSGLSDFSFIIWTSPCARITALYNRPSSSSRRGWRSPSRSAYNWASTACCRPASSRRTCKCCVSWRATKLAPILLTSEKTDSDVHSEAAVRITLSWEISLPQLPHFLGPIFFHICPCCTIAYCLFIPQRYWKIIYYRIKGHQWLGHTT